MSSDELKKLENISEELSKLTVVEAAALSKILEEKWGVSAAAPAAASGGSASVVEEKDEFDVYLVDAGDKDKKIDVIKAVRAITGLGLVEAKGMVDRAAETEGGSLIKSDVSALDCEGIIQGITAAGGKVVKK